MEISTYTITNGRPTNQDAFWWAKFEFNGSTGVLAAVCDGMGSLSNSQQASQVTAEVLSECLESGDISDSTLLSALSEANSRVVALGNAGTTVDVIRIYNGDYFILHLGDSRVYRVSPSGTAVQLTYDHSALNAFREQGIEITPDIVKKYQAKITKGIGKKSPDEPTVYQGKYSPGDSFLLCSDGFWHTFELNGSSLDLSDPDILEILTNRAIASGESDNITSLLIKDC